MQNLHQRLLFYIKTGINVNHNTVRGDRLRTYNVTLRRVCSTIVTVEKAMGITQTVCVFLDLGTRHANAHVSYRVRQKELPYFRSE